MGALSNMNSEPLPVKNKKANRKEVLLAKAKDEERIAELQAALERSEDKNSQLQKDFQLFRSEAKLRSTEFSQLQKDNVVLEVQASELQEDKVALEAQVSELKESKAALSERVLKLEEAIADLQADHIPAGKQMLDYSEGMVQICNKEIECLKADSIFSDVGRQVRRRLHENSLHDHARRNHNTVMLGNEAAHEGNPVVDYALCKEEGRFIDWQRLYGIRAPEWEAYKLTPRLVEVLQARGSLACQERGSKFTAKYNKEFENFVAMVGTAFRNGGGPRNLKDDQGMKACLLEPLWASCNALMDEFHDIWLKNAPSRAQIIQQKGQHPMSCSSPSPKPLMVGASTPSLPPRGMHMVNRFVET